MNAQNIQGTNGDVQRGPEKRDGLTGLDTASLKAFALRHAYSPDEADDLVQEALLAAIETGRTDFMSGQTRAWLRGVIRNKSRMTARGAARRKAREADWSLAREAETVMAVPDIPDVSILPPSLRLVAMLGFSGATRPEIAWLLGLSDTALRQRISQLKRALASLPDSPPADALKGALPFGVLRRSMFDHLRQRGGFLASHDPDGHIFVLSSSQNRTARQQAGEQTEEETVQCSQI